MQKCSAKAMQKGKPQAIQKCNAKSNVKMLAKCKAKAEAR